tara:strand:- start:288 stop:713 length:426 start_codon:yes stop_codon:yes gene_type:complete
MSLRSYWQWNPLGLWRKADTRVQIPAGAFLTKTYKQKEIPPFMAIEERHRKAVSNLLLLIGFNETSAPRVLGELTPVEGVELPGTRHSTVELVYDLTNPAGKEGYLGIVGSPKIEARFINRENGDYFVAYEDGSTGILFGS